MPGFESFLAVAGVRWAFYHPVVNPIPMRALPVIAVVLLLCVTPVTGGVTPTVAIDAAAAPNAFGVVTSVPTPQTDADSAPADATSLRVLSLPASATVRTDRHATRPDLGASLGLAVADTDGALRTETTVERVQSADAAAARERRILAAIDRVARAEADLGDRQAAAVDAHATGALSTRALLDELLAVATLAREYDRRLERLDGLARETPGFSAPPRLDELQLRLETYRGPVRSAALATARGERPTTTIRVASTTDGVVLATIDDDQYLRESLRRDRLDRDGGTVSSEAAIALATDRYPETTALRQPDAFGAGAVQRVTVPHDRGRLRAFVSGGTTAVFAEHQRIDLEAFRGDATVSTTADGFAVDVHRSYPGGPVAVTVRDESTGEPLEGVTVTRSVGDGDSRPIGETDGDGVVRTLSPDAPYRITVVDEPRVAVVDQIQPLATPRLAAAGDTSSAPSVAVAGASSPVDTASPTVSGRPVDARVTRGVTRPRSPATTDRRAVRATGTTDRIYRVTTQPPRVTTIRAPIARRTVTAR